MTSQESPDYYKTMFQNDGADIDDHLANQTPVQTGLRFSTDVWKYDTPDELRRAADYIRPKMAEYNIEISHSLSSNDPTRGDIIHLFNAINVLLSKTKNFRDNYETLSDKLSRMRSDKNQLDTKYDSILVSLEKEERKVASLQMQAKRSDTTSGREVKQKEKEILDKDRQLQDIKRRHHTLQVNYNRQEADFCRLQGLLAEVSKTKDRNNKKSMEILQKLQKKAPQSQKKEEGDQDMYQMIINTYLTKVETLESEKKGMAERLRETEESMNTMEREFRKIIDGDGDHFASPLVHLLSPNTPQLGEIQKRISRLQGDVKARIHEVDELKNYSEEDKERLLESIEWLKKTIRDQEDIIQNLLLQVQAPNQGVTPQIQRSTEQEKQEMEMMRREFNREKVDFEIAKVALERQREQLAERNSQLEDEINLLKNKL